MASSPADSSLSVGENSPSAVALMDDSPSLRRRRSAPSEADPLADILSKLGLGGDGSTVVLKKDVASVIAVMMEILFIPHDQAQFFLESANNDVAVAVDLHFELSGENNNGKRVRHDPPGFSNFMSGPLPQHRWQNRDVIISGLTDGWRASVSSTTGQILFQHIESGRLQSEVPPGFADAPPSSDNSMAAEDSDIPSDLPALVSLSQPSTAWSSPLPAPPPTTSFDFAPRSNIFKSSSPFLSPTSTATFTFGATSTTTATGEGMSVESSSFTPKETDSNGVDNEMDEVVGEVAATAVNSESADSLEDL